MTDYIGQFVDAMRAAGVGPRDGKEIQDTGGKWKHYKLHDDKGNASSGGYRLTFDQYGAVGQYRSFREGVTHTWNSEAPKNLTQDQRAEFERRAKEAKALRDMERKAEADLCAAKSALLISRSSEPPADHPYITRKGIVPHMARYSDDKLIIPMMRGESVVGYQWITKDGDKYYSEGVDKPGAHLLIGKISDTVLICEGWATGCSLHDATGLPVVVAFDAGNLKPVALSIRRDYPAAQIIFCADNDQWTVINGKAHNTGIVAAGEAGKAVDAHVVFPDFPSDDMDLRKDFNDLRDHEKIRAYILPVVKKREAGQVAESAGATALAVVDPQPSDDSEPVGDLLGVPFRILGYRDGTYYYFAFRQAQIVPLTASGHTMNNLIQLGPMYTWEAWAKGEFMKVRQSDIPLLAADTMINIATQRGVFAEEDRIRGAGAWMDAGRVMLHCGEEIYVNGHKTQPKRVQSMYTYVNSKRIVTPSAQPLTDDEGLAFRAVCELPTWEDRLSGSLLAGWLVIAPIGSALNWRPHIWITGQAEAGKSTIINRIVKPALGSSAICVDGGTTEPAIRDMMGYDGIPIVYDEAERSASIENVVSLARLSSDGKMVAKSGKRNFRARSAFCFSSINPPISDLADETRISLMVLKKNTANDAQEHYYNFLAKIEEIMTPDFPAKLLRRTIDNMPTLLQNIEIFKHAARTVIKGARASDQIAPMLAGLWLLQSTAVIDRDLAEEWVQEHDWSGHTAINEDPDPIRLVHRISTSMVRYTPKQGNSFNVSIAELIDAVVRPSDHIYSKTADSILRQHSISVVKPDGVVAIGNRNDNLAKLLRGTAWDLKWSRTLSDVPGAVKSSSSEYFNPGDKQRGTRIPLHYFTSNRGGDNDE